MDAIGGHIGALYDPVENTQPTVTFRITLPTGGCHNGKESGNRTERQNFKYFEGKLTDNTRDVI